MSAAAVVVAGGEGRRLGGGRKQFRRLGVAPLLAWCCEALARHPGVSELVVIVPVDVAEAPPSWLAAVADRVVAGGATRRESVRRGLAAVEGAHDVVLVHDGARPFLSEALVDRVLEAAAVGPAIPGLPLSDTVKMVGDDGRVRATLDRDLLRAAQTPQGFPLALLRELHESAAGDDGGPDGGAAAGGVTDDAYLCERAGVPVRVVPGEAWNVKVTTALDLAFARWWAESGAAEAAGVRSPPAT
ncbi:MAG: 2-C-methyl-D-erythritol 4-phosphate cytidylyltransferase [Gemmatimonadota bacterium]